MAPRQSNAPQCVTLRFKEQLSWKAGKQIPVTTLIKRLKTLSQELKELDQEDVDRDSLSRASKELCLPGLLSHKDKGVKAYTACCLADMLRLYAPDAPYTLNQLKDIFDLFVKQLKGLSDPDAPYFQQYIYLLDSLSSVKSVVLVSDVPNAEALISQIFTIFFDMAKPDGAKNIEFLMTDILVQLVEECNTVPGPVVDIIIAQFLRAGPANAQVTAARKKSGSGKSDPQQQTLMAHVLPPAYNMAKTICNQCVDKMSRYICQYFSEVILDSSPEHRSGTPDDEDESNEPSEDDLRELQKAHVLVKELWKACPLVLQNVVPQLEQELIAENVHLRLLAVDTIGEMALTGNLSSQFGVTWTQWLGRQNDKSPLVRSRWVEAALHIVDERNDHMLIPVLEGVLNRLSDGDERVRVSVCKAIGNLDYLSITTKLSTEGPIFHEMGRSGEGKKHVGREILERMAERTRDKRPAVRNESIHVLSRIWEMAYDDIASGNELVITQLGWIPSKVIEAVYVNEPQLILQVQLAMYETLFPLAKDIAASKKTKGQDDDAATEKKRAERLLILSKHLDEKAKRCFQMLVGPRHSQLVKVVDKLLTNCEKWNGGVVDPEEDGSDNTKYVKAKLTSILDFIAPLITTDSAEKTKHDLWRWINNNDRRIFSLMRTLINEDTSYNVVVRTIREINKRLDSNTLVETLRPLLYLISYSLYNKSHIPAIVEFSRTDENGLGSTAHEMLKQISDVAPGVFKAHVHTMCTIIQEQAPKNTDVEPDSGIVDHLRACSQFAKLYPSDFPQERKLFQALVSYALSGNNFKAAKYAVSIIMAAAPRKELYAADLTKNCVQDWKYGSKDFLAKLSSLSQLMLLAPAQAEEKATEITEICIQELLLKNRTPVGEDNSRDWVEDADLDDECWAKMLALKTLVNRLRAHPQQKKLNEFAAPIFRLLNSLISNEGEISKAKNTPKSHQSRLRLCAANCFLKLALITSYDNIISPVDFNRLSLVAQDERQAVRRGFVKKLKKYLMTGKLSSRFYGILFLMAYEPKTDLRDETFRWLTARGRLERQIPNNNNVLEQVFAKFISLLAHHPDFDTKLEDLSDFAKYILFYLQTMATEENISLIYHIAQRVKQYRDALETSSENIYYLSDLAQDLIRRFESQKDWSMQSWPGKIDLPRSLYVPFSDAELGREVAMKQFVPTEIAPMLNSLLKAATRSSKKRKSDGGSNLTGVKKKSKTSKPTRTAKTPKTPKRTEIVVPESERRRSVRSSAKKSVTYLESEDEEADEMEWEVDDGKTPKRKARDTDDESSELSDLDSDEETTTQTPSRPQKAAPKGKSTPKKDEVEEEDEEEEEKEENEEEEVEEESNVVESESPAPEPEPKKSTRSTRSKPVADTPTKKPESKPAATKKKAGAPVPTKGTRRSSRGRVAVDNKENGRDGEPPGSDLDI